MSLPQHYQMHEPDQHWTPLPIVYIHLIDRLDLGQAKVLLQMLRHGWWFIDKRWSSFSLTALAAACGIDPMQCNRLMVELMNPDVMRKQGIHDRIILSDGDHQIRVNPFRDDMIRVPGSFEIPPTTILEVPNEFFDEELRHPRIKKVEIDVSLRLMLMAQEGGWAITARTINRNKLLFYGQSIFLPPLRHESEEEVERVLRKWRRKKRLVLQGNDYVFSNRMLSCPVVTITPQFRKSDLPSNFGQKGRPSGGGAYV